MLSKVIPETPYEISSKRKPSLKHFHVWGCITKVKPCKLQIRKLDSKTSNGFFIGHCVGSRGFRFYCPSYITKVIELDHAIFFKDELNCENEIFHDINLRDEQSSTPMPLALTPVVVESPIICNNVMVL